jgi:hypothetical protein
MWVMLLIPDRIQMLCSNSQGFENLPVVTLVRNKLEEVQWAYCTAVAVVTV